MYYVYILRNKTTQKLYFGYTHNLERRIAEHNKFKEWVLIYYEAYLSEEDARKREQHLKHYGQSRTHLKNRIVKSLKIQN